MKYEGISRKADFSTYSMKSSAENRLLDLDRGLPATGEDRLALKKCRAAEQLDLSEYIRFLESFPSVSVR